MMTRPCSYALLTQNQSILLCRLSATSLDPGEWTLPGGGVEFGEHPDDALRHELLEETGYVVKPMRVLKIDSQLFVPDDKNPMATHVIRFLYEAEIVGGELCHEQNGSTDFCAWIPFSECDALPLVPVARLGVELMRKKDLVS